jgi:hypothetical protein
MNKVLFLGLAALGAALLSGCQSSPGPYLPPNTTKYSVESTDKFVLLDKYSQGAVTCTGLQERVTPENVIEVAANVKNREGRAIQVQVCCVFRNENAAPAQPGAEIPSDQTAWQTVALDANATETVRFLAPKTEDRAYSIHVRQAR